MEKRSLSDFCGEIFPKNLANYAVRLLAREQLLWRIQCREEETTRSGLVMRIYNLLSQQEEGRIDERFAEVVDMLEIVPVDNHIIERIIFGVDRGYSSEHRCLYEWFFLEAHFYRKRYFSMGVNTNMGSERWMF